MIKGNCEQDAVQVFRNRMSEPQEEERVRLVLGTWRGLVLERPGSARGGEGPGLPHSVRSLTFAIRRDFSSVVT